VSWDLGFWKTHGPAPEDPGAICNAFLEDGEPEGLDALAVAEVKAHFQAAFPGISDDLTELNWDGAGSYFQVSWPVGLKPGCTLGVFVSCGWNLLERPDVIERLRTVGFGLGCGIFDPQSDEWTSPPAHD
jgi:hypothetical protein